MAHEIIFILDQSGSMTGSIKETIRGYNSFLEEQRKDGSETLVTTVLFNNVSSKIHSCIDMKLIEPLTDSVYQPNGCTALLDAVGEAIEEVKNHRIDGENGITAGKVAFVIITDGMENASKTYSYDRVKDLIAECEKNGWEFIFLGADLTNSKDADRIGIKDDRRAFFSKSRMSEAYNDASKAIIALKKGGRIPDNWGSRFDREQSSGRSERLNYANELYCIKSQNKKLLIDTGSPISFGDDGFAQIGQHKYCLNRSSMLADIQKYMSEEISGILGMDILQGYSITLGRDASGSLSIDLMEGKAAYGSNNGKSVGRIVPVMGVPTIEVQVLGKDCRFFLDTGSGLTYISERLAPDFKLSGYKDDFYPMFGIFKVAAYDFKASVQKHVFEVQAGVLPEGLKLLMPAHVDGILGIDVLQQFVFRLDFVTGSCSIE